MKFLKFTFLFLTIFAFKTQAQQVFQLKGNVSDSLNKKQLQYASISLIRSKDSILTNFIRSKADGSFELNNISNDKYIVNISSPSFADYTDVITINNDINLGKVNLIAKAKLLESVEVQQKIAAIRLKGDTVEYKADSFKVGVNANVQELLRRLPGISVNSKGEISAQGQDVKKVLVDGEEFFSDDPAVVTKGLRADAIDKVQVFDKKSDQAAFTGIDDGVKDKTINLQLKEDKKKGYFGKLEIGNDFDNYRYGKAMINVFKGKKKFAAYGTKDNTNYESLNWDEKTNYGEDLSRETQVNEDGGMSMWSSGDDFSWGQGLPTSVTAGAHFSAKWKSDTHNIINTYQYNKLDVNGTTNEFNKTIVNDSNVTTENKTTAFNSSRNRNRLRTTYEWNIDSTSMLKAIITGSKINSKASSQNISKSDNKNGAQINSVNALNLNESKTDNLIGNIFWRKRFKKKGRTISLATDINYNNINTEGYLISDNDYFLISKNQKVDQQSLINEKKLGINTKLTYTEPLSKKTFLEISYRFNNNKNDAERITNKKNGLDTFYSIKIDSLTNHFIFNNFSHTGYISYKYQGKKINYSFGTGVGTVIFNLNDISKNLNRSLSFTNFLPNASFSFTPKKQTRLNLTYRGGNTNPTINQIQPVFNNDNQLNVTVGNPNLKQEFNHNFELNFNKYQVLKNKSIWMSSSFNFTNNAITSSSKFDSIKGVDTNQSVNTNGNYRFNAWCSYGFDLFPSFNLRIQFNPSFNRYVNFVNGKENINNSKSYRFGLSAGYWGEKMINYWFSLGPTYNHSTSSISNIENKYWVYEGNASINFKFKKVKTYLDFDANANLYQKTGQFANAVDVYKINVGLTKSIDKDENFQVKLFINDLFNSNADVSRNIMSNSISQVTRQAVQRFFMFSLMYNFSKNGKPSQGW